MNKGSDLHPAADLFESMLLAEMRRQAVNEVRRENGLIEVAPFIIYAEPFPVVEMLSAPRQPHYHKQCNCFYCK